MIDTLIKLTTLAALVLLAGSVPLKKSDDGSKNGEIIGAVSSDGPREPTADGRVKRDDGTDSIEVNNAWLNEIIRNRTREQRLRQIKDTLLKHLGRENYAHNQTFPNVTVPDIYLNNDVTIIENDYGMEKIRSFYPSCDLPDNGDDDDFEDNNNNLMILYFNFDYNNNNNEDQTGDIATATLRLYRNPADNSNVTLDDPTSGNCDNSTDEEFFRITIYWYKTLRQRRVRRRVMSDSRMVSQSSQWVDLRVREAARAWASGRRLGLAVQLEDQEGNQLRAEEYFKGVQCTVGASTPRPIPTIYTDAARRTNELHRIYELIGNDSSAPFDHADLLLPIIDICTVEFPPNGAPQEPLEWARMRLCNQRDLAARGAKVAADATSSTSRRQFDASEDPRNNIMGSKMIISKEELNNLG